MAGFGTRQVEVGTYTLTEFELRSAAETFTIPFQVLFVTAGGVT